MGRGGGSLNREGGGAKWLYLQIEMNIECLEFVLCSDLPPFSVVCNIELFSKQNVFWLVFCSFSLSFLFLLMGRKEEIFEGGGQAGLLFLTHPLPPAGQNVPYSILILKTDFLCFLLSFYILVLRVKNL